MDSGKKSSNQKNLFCSLKDLRNEASVESFFVDRLLKFLNYPDDKIRLKESIDQIEIGKGSKKEKYKPDYVLLDSTNTPKIIIDAKAPNEKPEDYHYQVSSYALHLNQKYKDNPVLYVVLTNGHFFIVYPWDNDQPIFYLRFEDFADGNEQFLELRAHLSYSAFTQISATKDVFDFQRPSLKVLVKTFNDCHDLIRKKESYSPTDAFYEFAKIMFIKIREDSKIHDLITKGKKIKEDDFIFSTKWIDRQVPVEKNPFDAILFRQIRENLEKQIQEKKKKRIFNKNENLELRPSTIYEIVKQLQNFDLYGIDEDLNGRMFETFLNATVRGRGLGQYFTPRGVVHYMVETSPISVSADTSKPLKDRMSYVFDGCSGSGGFLIDTMALFLHKIDNIEHLTNKQRTDYEREAKNNHIHGVESSPKISRICRLNMYLHGDGGSKIFQTDTLDKRLSIEEGISDEVKEGIEEFKEIITPDNEKESPLKYDVILSNPPFSVNYSSKDKHEKKVLEQYSIAKTSSGSVGASEKSNVLFLERYFDLLKENTGELLTIIDDTVLNGVDSQRYRDFIMKHFIIVQIVSLPFNTFFRAEANIKTSIIHLRKKQEGEKQGSIFMAITNNIGHDDHSRDTPERNNLRAVAKVYQEWKKTGKIEPQIIDNRNTDESLSCPLQIFSISADKLISKRLDAFYYSPELRNLREQFKKLEKDKKITLLKGSDFDIISEIRTEKKGEHRGKYKDFENKIFKYFEIGDVTRDGTITTTREDYFEKLPTRARLCVKKDDIILARNISSRGTTVLIPDWYNGNLVTTGFLGIRPKSHDESLLYWSILESEMFRKQIYYLAITASQPEIREEIFKNEILIPLPTDEKQKIRMIQNAKQAESARNNLKNALTDATSLIEELIH